MPWVVWTPGQVSFVSMKADTIRLQKVNFQNHTIKKVVVLRNFVNLMSPTVTWEESFGWNIV